MLVEECDAAHAHVCALPRSIEEHRELASRFLGVSGERGERAVFLDGAGDGPGLLMRMREDGWPVDRMLEAGGLVLVDREQTRRLVLSPPGDVVATMSSVLADALAEGYRGARVAGAAPGALRRLAGSRLATFDDAVDRATRGRPASVLCLYGPDEPFPGDPAAALTSRHAEVVSAPSLFDDGALRITGTGSRLRLAGEADLSHRCALHRVLADAAARGPLTVDTASLRFVDIGCLRTVVDAIGTGPTLARRSRAVERLLGLCATLGGESP